jgi:hypothetical protein
LVALTDGVGVFHRLKSVRNIEKITKVGNRSGVFGPAPE